MQEIELKFQVPADALAGVQADLQALAGADWAPWPLRAAYFDTPDRRLATARMALRVRQEGPDWVQTLKAGGSNTMTRIEDNCPARPPADPHAITADLALHQGRPAEAALAQVLGWQPAADPHGGDCGLVALYRTDITRWRCRMAVGTGTPHAGEVELALDLGHILSGPLQLPVRELEIELLNGHPMAVIEAGRQWMMRHGLWLDTQTKSHRGDRLARRADAWRAAAPEEAERLARAWAQTPPFPDAGRASPLQAARVKAGTDDAAEVWRAHWSAAIDGLTANLSEIATLAPADVTPAANVVREAWHAMGTLLAQVPAVLRRQTSDAALNAVTEGIKAHRQDWAAAGLTADAAITQARSPATTQVCLQALASLLPR